ncbi:phage regulatory CII family protein [Halomonas sp. M5N1S17]|uniref:phage regulatory CII family protein n=1 Tax=Halomonas alkalisoli TaxID=2907158 RepID=UPI001F19F15D|nr:phage regulatory CII family protein [Halomonas alkalisoli]MCE9664503.1 phage regulatory CII family protein [Halomonas alkalisoli]
MSRRLPNSRDRAQREVLPLSLALYHAARDYPGGIKAVAAVHGINPTTLQHKLSPTHEPHRPNIDDLEAVLATTGDARILDSLGEMAGCIFVCPCPKHVEGPVVGLLASVGELQQRVADTVKTLHESLEDGVIHPHEARELHLRVRRLMAASLAIEAAANNYAEGDE